MSFIAPRAPRGGGRGRGANRNANGNATPRKSTKPAAHQLSKEPKTTNPFLGAPAVQPATNSQQKRNGLPSIGRRGGVTGSGFKHAQNGANLNDENSGRKSKAWYEKRYEALKPARDRERAQAISSGKLADPNKRRHLSEAIVVVGTCEDMCPQFERIQRTAQNDVWAEEADLSTADLDTSQRIPDESRMVKRYKRAAAGEDEQLPSDLRPPHILKRTCDYLFHDVLRNAPDWSVHPFIWNRTRAIRNDFSIQQISRPAELSIAIECFERIARFHLLSLHQCSVSNAPEKYDYQQDREQLDRTLVSLMQYYDDCRGRVPLPNEAEFRTYSILFQLQNPDLEDRVQSWPQHIVDHPRVQTALKIVSAAANTYDLHGPMARARTQYVIAQQNWQRFWNLIESRSVSYLMGCAAELHFQLIRRIVLNSLLTAFRASKGKQTIDWTLDDLHEVLRLDKEDDVFDFCENYHFSFGEREDCMCYIDLNSVGGNSLPDPEKGLRRQIKSDAVEYKRFGRSWPAIIDGLNVLQAREVGEIEETEQRIDEMVSESNGNTANGVHLNRMGEDEDEESLFIPEAKEISNISQPDKPQPVTNGFASFGAPSKPSDTGSAFGKASTPFSTFQSFQPQAQVKKQFAPNPFSQTAPKAPSFDFLSKPTKVGTKPPDPGSNPFISDGAEENTTAPEQRFHFTPPQSSNGPGLSVAPQSNGKSIFESPFAAAKPERLPTFDFAKPAVEEQKKPQPPTESAKALFTQPGIALTHAETPFPVHTSPSSSAEPKTWQSVQPLQTPLQKQPQHSPDIEPAEQRAPSFSGFSGFSAKGDPPVPSKPETKPVTSSLDFTSALNSHQAEPSQKSTSTQSLSVSQSTQRQSPRSYSISKDDTDRPKKRSPLSNSLEVKDGDPAPLKSGPTFQDIISRLAEEIALDPIGGFLRQYIDFTVSNTITDIQEELWLERVTEEASLFRMRKLSVKFGRLWRDICKRKRLERKAREARERRRLGSSRMSSRRSSITTTSRKAFTTEDRSRTVDNLFRSLGQPCPQGAMVSAQQQAGTKRPVSLYESNDLSIQNQIDRKRQRSNTHVSSSEDLHQTKQAERSSDLKRSSFLGFSMSRPSSAAEIAKSTTKTNYFRLRAVGINPNTDLGASRKEKRKRSSSIQSDVISAMGARRASIEPQQANIDNEHRQLQIAGNVIDKSPPGAISSGIERAKEEDEALFARLRAAREGLKDTTSLFVREITQDEDFRKSLRRSQELDGSPSLQKARADARWRMSNSGSTANVMQVNVPAYRLRESKFVPKEQYSRAIERAREIRESRSRDVTRPSSRLGSRASPAASPEPMGYGSNFSDVSVDHEKPALPLSAQPVAGTVSQKSLAGGNFAKEKITSALNELPTQQSKGPSWGLVNNATETPIATQVSDSLAQPLPMNLTQQSAGSDFTSGFDAHAEFGGTQLQTNSWPNTGQAQDALAQPSMGFNFATLPPPTAEKQDFTIQASQIEESLSSSFGLLSQAPMIESTKTHSVGKTPSSSMPASGLVSLISSDDENSQAEEINEQESQPNDERVAKTQQIDKDEEDSLDAYGHANPFALLAEHSDEDYAQQESIVEESEEERNNHAPLAESNDKLGRIPASFSNNVDSYGVGNLKNRHYTQGSEGSESISAADEHHDHGERYSDEDAGVGLLGSDENEDEEDLEEDVEEDDEDEDEVEHDEEGEDSGRDQEEDEEYEGEEYEDEDAEIFPVRIPFTPSNGDAITQESTWAGTGGETADAPIELDSD